MWHDVIWAGVALVGMLVVWDLVTRTAARSVQDELSDRIGALGRWLAELQTSFNSLERRSTATDARLAELATKIDSQNIRM